MIDFQILNGPGGIPIYFQHVPVKSVSVYWLVFVGSADDESVGNHGIYHWFEHIPSRGTVKYPGGYRDTEARLVRHGGSAGAETDYTHTAYYADVPKRVWTSALDILTDMIAQPLLRPGDIEAEREIIGQEIDEWHSSPYGEALCTLPHLIWPGHPLGHDQLGSPETLMSMTPDMLRVAHEKGYARSRCVLFVAGDLEPSEVVDAVGKATENLSAAPLPERRKPANYGEVPAWQGGRTTIHPTRHDDSAIFLLFPIEKAKTTATEIVFWDCLEYLITAGDLGSPLDRFVREDSRLAYSPDFASCITMDGGYWGLQAQSNCKDPQQIIDCFWDVLKSEDLRSPEWFDFVRDTIRGEFDMQIPNPGDFTEEAAEQLTGYGEVWSEEVERERMLSVTRDDLSDYLQSLARDQSHAIIFQGDRNSPA